MKEKEAFLEKLRHYGKREGLWKPGDRILAAVSGGPDSLGLMLALAELRKSENFELFVCTVNHRIRAEAAAETAFVSRVAGELEIPCTEETVDVPGYRAKHGGSLETVARKLRYEALWKAAAGFGCRSVAAAHHRDDQAETVLYRLLRGSGPTGLRGMEPCANGIIRPFLCMTRAEIAGFLSHFAYAPCHDPTNDIPDTARNRIRLELMPLLKTYNPEIGRALVRTAEILREEDLYMETEANALFEQGVRKEQEGFSAERNFLLRIPQAAARRVLRKIWMRLTEKMPAYADIERVTAFLNNAVSGKRTSASGVMAEMRYGRVWFYPGSTRSGASASAPADWILTQEEREAPPVSLGDNQLVLDKDRVGAVFLKYRQRGDRFAPLGFSGTKPLSKYMNELRIPKDQRDSWPLAADETHIYWIGGRGISRYGRPDASTKRYMILTLRRNHHGTADERH